MLMLTDVNAKDNWESPLAKWYPMVPEAGLTKKESPVNAKKKNSKEKIKSMKNVENSFKKIM